MDTFRSVSTPPTNYVGTVLFISYIIAALILTASITLNLSQRYTKTYNALPKDIRERLRLSVRLKAAFAALCFTALSTTMINVLLTSHHKWSLRNNLPSYPPPSPSLSDVGEWSTRLLRWMLQTSLFRDFANDLLLTSGTVICSQLALLWTGAVMTWMGLRGRSAGVQFNRLGRYFALGQILPVSFAMNLLAIDLTITRYERENHSRSKTAQGETVQGKADAVRRPGSDRLRHVQYRIVLGAINMAYAGCILSLSAQSRGSPYLITGIFVLRGFLLAPLLVPLPSDIRLEGSAQGLIVLTPSVIAAARVLYVALQSSMSMASLLGAVNAAPAVQAVGWDLVPGVAGTLFFVLGI